MDISALKRIREYVENAPTPYVGGVKGRVCLSEKQFIVYLIDTEIDEIQNNEEGSIKFFPDIR
jgi:hypothetical protein